MEVKHESNLKFVSGDKDLFNNYKTAAVLATIQTGPDTVLLQVQGKQRIKFEKEYRLTSVQTQTKSEKEARLYSLLKNSPSTHIIGYLGNYVCRDQRSKSSFFLMEKGLCHVGRLAEMRREKGQHFIPTEVTAIFKTVVGAHLHLQKLGLSQRQLKPQSLQVTQLQPLQLKVSLLGLMFAADGYMMSKSVNSYMSKEQYQAYLNRTYIFKDFNPFKSNVYSLALLLLQLCSGRQVLPEDRKKSGAIELIVYGAVSQYRQVSGLGQLLEMMLLPDPAERPDFVSLDQRIEREGWLKVRQPEQISLEQVSTLADMKKLQKLAREQPRLNQLRVVLSNIAKDKQVGLFFELEKVRFLDLVSLTLQLQLNGLAKQQVRVIASAVEKNIRLRELHLNLWNNNIDGDGGKVLLAAIGSLEQLQQLGLNLSTNQIDDRCVIQNIGRIERCPVEQLELQLGMNRLTIASIPAMFRTIGKIQRLHSLVLNFESNRITPAGLKNVKTFLKGLALTRFALNVSGNKVKDAGFFEIGDIVHSLRQLKAFSLVAWSTLLDDQGFTELMKSMSESDQLQELSLVLWNNDIGPKSLQWFGESLARLDRLQKLTLNLSNNPLTNQGLRRVCKAIIKLDNISSLTLHFEYSKCSSQALRYVGRLLSVCRLRYFNCCMNNNYEVGPEGMTYLVAGLSESKNMEELQLGMECCGLTDEAVTELAKSLQLLRLSRLALNVSDNKLWDEGAVELCRSLSLLKGLKQNSVDYRKNEVTRATRRRLLMDFPLIDIKLTELKS